MQQQDEKTEQQQDLQKIETNLEYLKLIDNYLDGDEITQEQQNKPIIEDQSRNQSQPDDDLIQQFGKISIQENKEEITEHIDQKFPQVQKEKAQQNDEQVQIIKGTQRADGSYRKDIKVRPGYKNDEMVKKYVIPQKR